MWIWIAFTPGLALVVDFALHILRLFIASMYVTPQALKIAPTQINFRKNPALACLKTEET